jgi:hypothetical protein
LIRIDSEVNRSSDPDSGSGFRICFKEDKTDPQIKNFLGVEELDILPEAGRFTWSLEILRRGLRRNNSLLLIKNFEEFKNLKPESRPVAWIRQKAQKAWKCMRIL